MDISWIVFIGALLFFAWRGYRQGPWLAASRLVSLVAAYGVAIRFSQPLAAGLAAHIPLSGLPARIAAGMLLFFGTAFLVSGLFTLMDKLLNLRASGSRSSAIGAIVGAGVGSLFGLAAVLALSYLQDVGAAKDASAPRQPSALESFARTFAGEAFETVGSFAVDDSTGRMGAALVRDPLAVVNQLRQVAQNPEARQFFNSPEGHSARQRRYPGDRESARLSATGRDAGDARLDGIGGDR